MSAIAVWLLMISDPSDSSTANLVAEYWLKIRTRLARKGTK